MSQDDQNKNVADSPWNEPLPEEPQKSKVTGSLTGGQIAATPSKPFVLPEDIEKTMPPVVKADTATPDAGPNKAFEYSFNNQPTTVPPANSLDGVGSLVMPVSSSQPQTSPQANPPASVMHDSLIVSAQPKVIDAIGTISAQPTQVIAPPATIPVAPSNSGPVSAVPPLQTHASEGGPVGASMPPPMTPQAPPVAVDKPVATPSLPVTVVPVVEKKAKKGLFGRSKSKQPKPPVEAVQSAPKNNPRSGKTFALLAKIIAGLIVAMLLFIVLTESGMLAIGLERFYGSVGLERIWGGLPKDAEKALGRSLLSMSDHPQFAVNGTMTMNIDKTIDNAVTTPFANAEESTGKQVENIFFTDKTTTKIINGTVAANFSTEGNVAEIKVARTVGSSSIYLKNDSKKLWVKSDQIKFSPEVKPEKWLLYDLVSMKVDNAVEPFVINVPESFTVVGSRLGSEKVETVRCYKYDLESIEIGDGLASLGVDSDSLQSVSGTAWIGVRDKLIRRIDLKITTAPSSPIIQLNLSMSFSGFDEAKNFDPPAGTEVIKAAN